MLQRGFPQRFLQACRKVDPGAEKPQDKGRVDPVAEPDPFLQTDGLPQSSPQPEKAPQGIAQHPQGPQEPEGSKRGKGRNRFASLGLHRFQQKRGAVHRSIDLQPRSVCILGLVEILHLPGLAHGDPRSPQDGEGGGQMQGQEQPQGHQRPHQAAYPLGAPIEEEAQQYRRQQQQEHSPAPVQQSQQDGDEPFPQAQPEGNEIHFPSSSPSIRARSSLTSASDSFRRRVKAARKAGTLPPKEESISCSLFTAS